MGILYGDFVVGFELGFVLEFELGFYWGLNPMPSSKHPCNGNQRPAANLPYGLTIVGYLGVPQCLSTSSPVLKHTSPLCLSTPPPVLTHISPYHYAAACDRQGR